MDELTKQMKELEQRLEKLEKAVNVIYEYVISHKDELNKIEKFFVEHLSNKA